MNINLELRGEQIQNLGRISYYDIHVENKKVGKISITEFVLENLLTSRWRFIDEILIFNEYRNRKIAKNTLIQIDNKFKQEEANGILLNAITIQGAKNMYDNLGWQRLSFDPRWQILINKPISNFVMRKVYEKVN